MIDLDELINSLKRNSWEEQVEALASRNGKRWNVFYGDILKRYTKSIISRTKLLLKRKRFTDAS